MNLRDQLKGILPEILPENPGDAIKGTELIRLVKYKLESDYSDATLRYHFSIMCCDPSSPIAKVEQGQGYYLRPQISSLDGARKLIRMSQGLLLDQDPEEVDLALSRRNKFCALYTRFCEEEHRFPYLFEGPQGDHLTRDVVWRLPDGALVDWDLGHGGEEFEIDPASLAIKGLFGAQPFTLTSITIKLGADYRDFRQDFFQCLSNSGWAHRGELILASSVIDSQLVSELADLGNRFGIAITSFGIELDEIDGWPEPLSIKSMSESEFDALRTQLSIQKIAMGQTTPALDWGALSGLRKDSDDLEGVISWVTHCVEEGRAMPYEEFEAEGKGLAS